MSSQNLTKSKSNLSNTINNKQRGIFSELINGAEKSQSINGPSAYITKSQYLPFADTFANNIAGNITSKSRTYNEPENPIPPSAFLPKVSLPYETEPGQVPREIEIERKRREYTAMDIEELLKQLDIDYSVPEDPFELYTKIPLEIFDNTEFDCRGSPDEWLETGTADGEVKGVPAKTLIKKSNGTGEWMNCLVKDYNKDTDQYIVELDSTKEEVPVYRLNLLFLSEDPRVFAQRVAAAHKKRKESADLLRYHLYVDCMPVDDLPTLDTEKTNRITKLALSTPSLESTASTNTNIILNEINLSYARAMNKIIFDHNSCTDVFPPLKLPPPEKEKPVPFQGTIVIPKYDFVDRFNEFSFNSLYTKDQVILGFSITMAECLKIEELSLFKTRVAKSLRLDEFDTAQSKALNDTTLYLSDTWIPTVKTLVVEVLKDAGKGWFNLKEDNTEVYQLGKLSKFFRVCKFIMQDSLRNMTEASLRSYVDDLLQITDITTTVVDYSKVENIYNVEPPPNTMRRPAFYSIDLVLDGKDDNISFKYSTDIKMLAITPIVVLEKALKSLTEFTSIDRLIMDRLFWSKTPLLAAVQVNEPWVTELKTKLETVLNNNLIPLEEYLQSYDKFLEFIRMDPEKYLSEIVTKHQDIFSLVVEMNDLADHHEKEYCEIVSMMPNSIVVGMCVINTTQIKNALSTKHAKLKQKILDILNKKSFEAASALFNQYEKILKELNHSPEDIEHLVQLEEYITTIPQQLKDLSETADRVAMNYEVLLDFQYKMRYPDFEMEWDVVGWPKRIMDKVAKVTEELVTIKEKFSTDLEEEEEEFVELLKTIDAEVRELKRFTNIEHVAQVSQNIRTIKAKLEDANAKARLFNSREGLFNKSITDYDDVRRIEKNFEPYRLLWESVDDWQKYHKQWMEDSFLGLDAEEINIIVDRLFKDLTKAYKSFNTQNVEGCLDIAANVKKEVQEFMPYCPLITAMRTPGMEDRHWEEISKECEKSVHPDENFTLSDVMRLNLKEYEEVIVRVGEKAGKENDIKKSLDEMEQQWEDTQMDIASYKDTGTFILRGVDEIMQILDAQITMTQVMTFSAYKAPFEDRINKWNETLSLVSDVFDEWIQVQRNWLYLQPIFDSPDINKQLPTEGKRFGTVDKNWRQTMKSAKSNTSAIKFANSRPLLEKFQESNKLLDLVQKGLTNYLETKRGAFARFYFLSNDELLEILSQTKDPTRVQPHLRKCFEAIQKVTFEDDLTITAMHSSEGEKIDFIQAVNPKNKNVEFWMSELETQMKNCVKSQCWDAICDYILTPRGQWMQKWPGQCVLNCSQVHWTKEIEESLKAKGNKGIRENYEKQLKQLDVMVSLVRGELSNLTRITIGALAVIDVHARDVTKNMVDNGVSDTGDFLWMSQLRYYWIGEGMQGDMFAEMVISRRPYGYEYLGNSMRLVITPLTDKCYLTLMGALQMILGGSPQGPAGTGKTETTKDLAKALAKQCIVFNCSDSMDYKMTGKFFKGLAACGAWACFDEFNRILIEVLSVIAQQILTLQQGVQEGKTRIYFEDREIPLSDQFAVFITMNPGYAGRTELPDNLKALFRPVAMMVPDYALIGEIMLFAYGFENARTCAQKMVATFRLCSEQLSSQDHYDYGMRAVKTVIVAAGNLKREYPNMDEETLMLRGLMDVNLPKFLAQDLPLFKGIMSDLFPGKSKPDIDYGLLLRSMRLMIEKRKLQPTPYFLEKCIQLYEMIIVRHGLMVVGPTGSGKTSNIQILAEALTYLNECEIKGNRYEKVQIKHLNPKSITMGQLYGEFDINTHEWRDGILANIIRLCVKEGTTDLKWVLFDGPVDTLWIESMNTVLDDNKKLCLNSGEIIALSPEMTMMFEPADLAVASPATVSRCGMIYMEPNNLGLDPPFRSWLENIPEAIGYEHKCKLQQNFDLYIPTTLTFLRKYLHEPIETVDNNLAGSLVRILDCYFSSFQKKEGQEISKEKIDHLLSFLDPLFIFALIWSVCCTVDYNGRIRFDRYLRNEMENAGMGCPIPSDGLIYDYRFDLEEGTWVPWKDPEDVYKYNPRLSFSELLIPTMDTARYTFLLDLLLLNDKHVLMTGPTGTGKSAIINSHLQTGMPEKYVPLAFTFSAQTSANQTQDIIDSKCEKRRKGIYGPPAGKRFIIFVDDVNMPQREEFFAQPPIELLRQWLCTEGWYDRTTLLFKKIIDSTMVLACGPPGGGRNPVTPRFFRHFNIITFTDMQYASMYEIFHTILSNFLLPFNEDIRKQGKRLVNASIQVYTETVATLLPTPARTHYTFNLRDLSKVFQGILMISNTHTSSADQIVRIWVHECRRVFADRLINDEDRSWFNDTLMTKVRTLFKMNPEEIIPNRLFCCDFMVPGADPRIYEEVQDITQLVPTVEEYLSDYNMEKKPAMNLVLFMDAVEHVSRVSRIIRQPEGNALLLGVGGSGRQSLTRLATFMADYELFQIEVSKEYRKDNWRDDVKKCLLQAGLKQKPTVFLFVDTQIVFESMLEDVNNILNGGDIPNLYGPDEMDDILTTCRVDCQKKNIQPTKLNIFAQYILRVKQNIHMVLCMSPIGTVFRSRLRMFPSLSNNCTIDWFTDWPDEALETVAKSSMTQEDLGFGDHLPGMVDYFKFCHMTISNESARYLEVMRRHNYVTPTSFLELLSTYKNVLISKRKEVDTLRTRLSTGVNKMKDAEQQIASLQVQINEKKPKLEQTQIEVDEMIVKLEKDKKVAGEKKKVVEKEEAESNEKARITQEIADDAERDLAAALPALEKAVECLKDLKKADLDEVRAMGRPPEGVKLTLKCCCIMFGMKPVMKPDPDNIGKKIEDYFDTAKKELLSNPGKLLNDLVNFDKDHIEDSRIVKITPYISDPEFDPERVANASKACRAICLWVRAMYSYDQINKEVEPKRKKLAEAKAVLDESLKSLAATKAQLDEVNNNIAQLEATYQASVQKKEALAADLALCVGRLQRAETLTGGLGGEKKRWIETIENCGIKYNNLIGDALISGATIAYLGAFTPDFRHHIVDLLHDHLKSHNIPHTDSCNIITTLNDPVLTRRWQIFGLPSDNHSLENGLIMDNARRYPLFIDPQGQANQFIRNMGKDTAFAINGIDICKMTDENRNRVLENGVRFGRWVLLENVLEQIEASIEPLLQQQKFMQGGTMMVKVGDSTIPWNDQFRFFMTTKLPNPHYPPEVCVKVTLLNFTITPVGLEDQLLGDVVRSEMPELEEKKNALIVSSAKMRKDLQDIESKMLANLSNSSGNILDDIELINTLDTAKKTSTEINAQVEEAEKTEKEIDETREMYRPVANRGSILFFAIADLANADPMYQYSLGFFQGLFRQALQKAEPSAEIQKRLENLKNEFTRSLYRNICRSLFEKHKLMFSFILCVRILQGRGEINEEEWRFLLSGISNQKKVLDNPASGWLVERAWNEFLNLSGMSAFEDFENDFISHIDEWKAIFDSDKPQSEKLPGKWEEKLNLLQKMCVLRCLRPDKISEAVQNFVIEKQGIEFVQPPPFDLQACYEDSTTRTPLIFVLTTGSDPTKMFYDYARQMRMGNKAKGLSLGQGQGEIATEMIKEGVSKGLWIYLQNCHLYISWMTSLERIVNEIDPENTHKDFRLWLSSMPSKDFPVSILQNGIKMTMEPPKGLRSNLLNTYYKLDDEKLQITSKPKEYMKLLFALSFFHATVQERRKYGPLGWNKQYEFNDSDFDISKSQLELFLDKYEEVPYKVLNTLVSYINYGGRVTDYIDLRTIDVLLRELFCPDIMRDDYSFSVSGIYYSVPIDEDSPSQGYMNYIESLPINPEPEVFGMHANANITCAESETYELFNTILLLQPQSAGGGGMSRDDQLMQIATAIEEKLPPLIDTEAVQMKYPLRYEESMNTVLGQECIRYNKLLSEMKRTLPELKKAIKGLVVMSSELEDMGNSLYNQWVPKMWEMHSYPSLKPLNAWVQELLDRLQFITKWYEDGIPNVFWISGFFFPQAFLTGTLQNYARKHHCPIDTVSFGFEMIDEPWETIKAPEDGCLIRGLYLEGARWDPEIKSINDSRPKELYTEMPVIHLIPIENRENATKGIYRCPVYKILCRWGVLSTTGHSSNFIMWIEIPSNRREFINDQGLADQDVWIKAGVAAFCSLKY